MKKSSIYMVAFEEAPKEISHLCNELGKFANNKPALALAPALLMVFSMVVQGLSDYADELNGDGTKLHPELPYYDEFPNFGKMFIEDMKEFTEYMIENNIGSIGGECHFDLKAFQEKFS